jgi:hypothetical protein
LAASLYVDAKKFFLFSEKNHHSPEAELSPIEMWGMKDLRTMHDSLLIYLLNVACQRYATVCQLLVAWKNGHYSLVLCVWHATDTAPLNISY